MRNCHIPNLVAIRKSGITNVRYAVWHRHMRKTTATIERSIPDARHRIGDCHACKTAAIVERRRSDTRHAVRYYNFRSPFWAKEYTSPTIRQQESVCRIENRIYRINNIILDFVTPGKRIGRNVRHTGRNRHARKTAAAIERRRPDARHRVRYRHARKFATVGKRQQAYTIHRFTAKLKGYSY